LLAVALKFHLFFKQLFEDIVDILDPEMNLDGSDDDALEEEEEEEEEEKKSQDEEDKSSELSDSKPKE